MAAVVTQDMQSSYVPNKSAELNFTIRGATSEDDAYTALVASGLAPEAFNGIQKRNTTISTEYFDSTHTDKSIFRATVSYYIDPFETEVVRGFDTTGGQQHITQSYGTARYPGSAVDCQGAINYDGTKVAGVDIVIPAMTFTEQHYKSYAQCSASYRKTLSLLTGKLNNNTFRTYAAGEVLFKGAAGQQVVVNGTSKWQINYTFAISPNRSNFTVGNISVTSKVGWDYLWVMYADVLDGINLVKRPAGVYIERIYDFADFGGLDIG